MVSSARRSHRTPPSLLCVGLIELFVVCFVLRVWLIWRACCSVWGWWLVYVKVFVLLVFVFDMVFVL